MVRKSFLVWAVLLVTFIAEIYLIASLFLKTKTWSIYWFAVAGFVLLPVTLTLVVRLSKLQPTSKVIVTTGIWVAWTVLAGIAALATYYYWVNNPGGPVELMPGSNL